MAEAIYSLDMLQGRNFVCRIPKKRGDGLLKSVFGFHSTNEAASKWAGIKPEIATGDYCDLDGHLDIELRYYRWDERYEQGVEELCKSLSAVFPQITSWRKTTLTEVFGLQLEENN